MSQVIQERNIKEELLEDLEDFDIELFPVAKAQSMLLKEGVQPIEDFTLSYREKEIGFMMIIPKDKLSDEESVALDLARR